MTSLAVLLPPPRRAGFDGGLAWLALSIPLGAPGLMSGGPFRPFSRAFSPRNSTTVRVSSATRPSSSATRAFNSAFDRPSKSGGGIPTRNPKSAALGTGQQGGVSICHGPRYQTAARTFAPLTGLLANCMIYLSYMAQYTRTYSLV